MTKYKAGDKVTIVLDVSDAATFNECEDEFKIIAHEPAPKPIVKFGFVLGHGGIEDNFITLEGAKMASLGYQGVVGYFKTTITGNDFTVEKVTG